ncbi:MAG: FmdB family zinc ribbon protein [Spirochaetota bacterium]
MPTYQYVCTECGEMIEVNATISQKEKGLDVICPKCGSKKVVRLFGGFFVVSSSGGASNMPGCGPQAGPGCCG